MCPGSSDPFYVVTYYIKWVTTSWTYGITMNYYAKVTDPGILLNPDPVYPIGFDPDLVGKPNPYLTKL